MNCGFEKVTRLADIDFPMPVRKTENSAGYDMVVAEDIIVPPYASFEFGKRMVDDIDFIYDSAPFSLDEVAKLTKENNTKPTLVSTGVKCKLPKGKYLELSVRSSSPLKYWLLLANGIGIIDADYYNNESNEGEIFFQLINLSPYPIQLRKGDIIGQGIIKSYELTDDDIAHGKRTGGFGSTTEKT